LVLDILLVGIDGPVALMIPAKSKSDVTAPYLSFSAALVKRVRALLATA
jgi:hypothetical protein